MRALCFAFICVGAMACADEGPCGLDPDGNQLPTCEVDGAPNDGIYCPNDHWGADDDCNSCGCSPDGQVVCTQNVCE